MRPPVLDSGKSINVLKDVSALQVAFESAGQPIIEYPGDAGDFFNLSLERDGFVAFMGREKSGKTFMLCDTAWRAMLQKRRVAFFAIGDMSQSQMLRRFSVRASRWPALPGKVAIPTQISKPRRGGLVEVTHRYKEFEKGLTLKRAIHNYTKILNSLGGDEYLRLSVHPSSSINMHGIRAIIDNWSRLGWVPDVIVIDYADLLARLPGYEGRDSINESWKLMRSLSTTYNNLVVTATQADADSYDSGGLLTMSNFTEDKRKFSHVTAMFGINPPQDANVQRRRD